MSKKKKNKNKYSNPTKNTNFFKHNSKSKTYSSTSHQINNIAIEVFGDLYYSSASR
jgi:hypothetical protein